MASLMFSSFRSSDDICDGAQKRIQPTVKFPMDFHLVHIRSKLLVCCYD